VSTDRPEAPAPPEGDIPPIDAETWASTPPAARNLVLSLANTNARLAERVTELTGRVRELEEQLRTNSSNSSKPPSSDPPGNPPSKSKRAKGSARRKKTAKKKGGQPGHSGKSRPLLPPDKVDEIVDCRPGRCECGGEVVVDDQPSDRRQVWEIPPVVPKVTEYRTFGGRCQCCGCGVMGVVPAEAGVGMLGPRAMATAGVLSGEYRLSKRAVADVFKALFGLVLSVGTVSNNEQRVSEAAAAPVEEARSFVPRQPVVHADETGWKLGPSRKRGWLWTGVTSAVVIFLLRWNRSAAVAKELLGDAFSGTLVSDRYSAYNWVPLSRRQACWAHLKRDFKKIADRPGDSRILGALLLNWVDELFTQWHRFRQGELTRSELIVAMEPVRQATEELLSMATESTSSKTANTCEQILKVKDTLWTFVHVEGVEPTNNAAERAIRPAVMWRKMCFGTDSERGARFVERILTVSATCRRQGRDTVEFLRQAIVAHRTNAQPPSLLPEAQSLPL